MKVVIFEGTPDEFKAVAPYIGGQETESQILPTDVEGEIDSEQEMRENRKEAIKSALNRLSLTEHTLKFFQILAEGEIQYETLVERMGVGKKGMTGITGSLGRRMAGTPEIARVGLPGNINAMVIYRLERGVYYLSLTEEAFEVLKEEEYI